MLDRSFVGRMPWAPFAARAFAFLSAVGAFALAPISFAQDSSQDSDQDSSATDTDPYAAYNKYRTHYVGEIFDTTKSDTRRKEIEGDEINQAYAPKDDTNPQVGQDEATGHIYFAWKEVDGAMTLVQISEEEKTRHGYKEGELITITYKKSYGSGDATTSYDWMRSGNGSTFGSPTNETPTYDPDWKDLDSWELPGDSESYPGRYQQAPGGFYLKSVADGSGEITVAGSSVSSINKNTNVFGIDLKSSDLVFYDHRISQSVNQSNQGSGSEYGWAEGTKNGGENG